MEKIPSKKNALQHEHEDPLQELKHSAGKEKKEKKEKKQDKFLKPLGVDEITLVVTPPDDGDKGKQKKVVSMDVADGSDSETK